MRHFMSFRFLRQFGPDGYLWEDGGAAGAGTGDGAGAAGAAGDADKTGDNGGDAGAARTGAAVPGKYAYDEDRSNWIPPHRLKEETGKRQALETQIAERDKKIAALAGTSTPDAKTEKAEQIKQAMFEMFPWAKRFSDLSDDQINALLDAPKGVETAKHLEHQQWERHSDTQMTSVFEQVADVMGAESLNDEQKSDLRDGFAAWLRTTCNKELQASDGQTSKTLSRYEKGDPALLAEFVKRYTANWVEPARRKATAQAVSRTRAVPDARGRTPVTSVTKPAKFNSLDERLDYAAKLAKERGVTFSA